MVHLCVVVAAGDAGVGDGTGVKKNARGMSRLSASRVEWDLWALERMLVDGEGMVGEVVDVDGVVEVLHSARRRT